MTIFLSIRRGLSQWRSQGGLKGVCPPSTPKNFSYLGTIFSYAPYQQLVCSHLDNFGENSHDYASGLAIKSKDFIEMKGF
jgi:hypothetical protein